MTKKKTDADARAVVACVTEEISNALDFFFARVEPSDRGAAEVLVGRLLTALIFASLKAGLDPETSLRQGLASIHLTDQAMKGPGELAPRIPHVAEPMSEAEMNQLAVPIYKAVNQLELAGVSGVQTAGVLLTLAARMLVREAKGNFRAASLAISAFAAAVDKGHSIRQN